METTNPPTPETKQRMGFAKFLFINLQIAIGVALLLATLFTIWTPGETAQNPSWEVAQLVPIPTARPTIGSTAIVHLRPLIGIVAGHSGNDSGTVCSDGLTEVQVNQSIAELVRKKLTASGYDVDVLKEFDSRLTGYKALALVSIHADSCYYINDQATGFKVAAAMVNPHPETAARLTACLRSRYAQATGLPLHSTSVTRDMTEYHAFGEIDPNTTAAIVETGFLNLDRQFLTDHADLAAEGIVKGILCFINNENITQVTPQPTP
ncbi:MAG: cell wall hydrolase/autolysin family protein [Chloroflexi bacterium]|jgi:N-acetylmuramoyl-L-alanine amidase|nr:cell wall hydrolase/autolysin family protein [Chloroflexota bacterium]